MLERDDYACHSPVPAVHGTQSSIIIQHCKGDGRHKAGKKDDFGAAARDTLQAETTQ